MEYIVVEASTIEKLQELVNREIENGFRPQGGVNVFAYEFDKQNELVWNYAQAMTRSSHENQAVPGLPVDRSP